VNVIARSSLLILAAVLMGGVAGCGQRQYRNLDLSPQARAADLVSRMSLDEKVAQMSNQAAAIRRLDVAEYDYWNECVHGVARAGEATVFPAPIGMAATFDLPLVHDIADAISTEARAKNQAALAEDSHGRYQGLTFWSPNINIFRDPRWGRGQETYGEDPFLTSRMAVEFIRGLQGDDPRYLKVAATAKHFAVHSGPEFERHAFNAVPPERDLYETYLPQFEAAVREAHVASVMGAYNALDGQPCCASDLLLRKLLRDRWGFDGFVVSDCGAIKDIWESHHAAASPAQAAADAVNMGCDLECGGTYAYLVDAVNQGLISQDRIDQALVRIFTVRFRLGMFDPDERVPFTKIGPDQNCTPQHAALARRAADESLVLLKNDGLLPLDRSHLRSIALIGPNIDSLTAYYSNYNGVAAAAPTLLESLRAKLGPTVEVIGIRGCEHAAASGWLEVIPDLCLRHDGKPGLRAEYFTNPDLQGEPFRVRDDLSIDFAYRDTPHIPAYPAANNSARWTGQFVAPQTGSYTLAVVSNDANRFWVDGRLINDLEQTKIDRPAQLVNLQLSKDQAINLRLEYSHGTGNAQCALMWDRQDLDLTNQVVAQAKDADAIIFAGGITGDIEGEEGAIHRPVQGFDGDRRAIELPQIQTHLIQALAATGKPLVLVNFSGSAMAMPWEADHLRAIVQAWYPGQAGGAAIVDALFGDTCPAGRLPITFYRSTAELPPFADYAMKGRTYRFFTGRPLWAFGHGLSYTTFRYSNLSLEKAQVGKSEDVRLSLDVSNTGARDGQEVVQVYVHRQKMSADDPLRNLRALGRVTIALGQTKRVALTFPAASLRRWDTDQHDYVIDPGDYELEVGAASDDPQVTTTFRIGE
jgi:beta-glucosidase